MKKFIKEIYNLRPWYHDFSRLGVQTNFPPEKKYRFFGPEKRQTRLNMDQQDRKESVIYPYIQNALGGMEKKDGLSILDLFCSDGYYGLLAQKLSPGSTLVGVDINAEDINRCRVMSRYTNCGPSTFIEEDVYKYVESADIHDLVLCNGGLYHISDPKRLLDGVRKITGQYLVVQSAITVEHDKPDYFESPNPWFKTWGSLFTNSRLLGWLEEAGFSVVENTVNKRVDPDYKYIGSSYVLLK